MTANRFNFRAYILKEKYMVDVEILHPEYILAYDGKNYNLNNVNNSKNYVIMQSTGLVDKNGEEIYEGDIIKFDGKYTKAKRLIRYSKQEGRLVACYTDFVYDYCDFNKDWISQWEVIGNIYENPELLKN